MSHYYIDAYGGRINGKDALGRRVVITGKIMRLAVKPFTLVQVVQIAQHGPQVAQYPVQVAQWAPYPVQIVHQAPQFMIQPRGHPVLVQGVAIAIRRRK